MEQKIAQLQAKIEADPSLVEKLFAQETAEEVQSFLNAQGLIFSLEEIDALRNNLVKALEKSEAGELSDNDLEEVAGGVITNPSIHPIPIIGPIVGPIIGPGPINRRW